MNNVREKKLSNRMRAVADLVKPVKCLADIGCDHAYLSIDLIERGIAEHVIAMDRNNGPLKRAEEHIRERGLQNRIEVRQSDGTERLRPGEANAILLAGMGGELMIRILQNGAETATQCQQLILQPQSEQEQVRRYVEQAGFAIEEENMVCEEGKYYVMFSCRPAKEGEGNWNNPVWYRYGKNLLESGHPVMKEFLEKQQSKCRAIVQNMQKESPGSAERMAYLLQEIEYRKEALSYYEVQRNYDAAAGDCTGTVCS